MQADESATHSQVAIGGQTVIHKLAHKPSTQHGNTKQPGTLICTNCGRRGHRAKNTICPALNQTCSLSKTTTDESAQSSTSCLLAVVLSLARTSSQPFVCRSTGQQWRYAQSRTTSWILHKIIHVTCPTNWAPFLISSMLSLSVRSFIFDPNAPTFATTAASDVGLGAVLSQTQQGREVPIAHISHTLQPRERAYAVNEKEALACVWACETWKKYLLGRHFTLRTDHSSLASLLRSTTDSRKSAKFTRWLDRLSPFDYTVEYRQGKDNLVADALSRLSMRSAQSALHDSTHVHVVGALQTDHLSLLDVKSATKRDSTLSTVLHFVSSGWSSKKTLAPDIQQFFAVRDELQTEDQCLLRENRIVLLTALRRRLLAKAHEGHPEKASNCHDARTLQGDLRSQQCHLHQDEKSLVENEGVFLPASEQDSFLSLAMHVKQHAWIG
ncbi:integrase core domain protein [Plakobranchus ocellatus]|uniref:Integrase core domain protein n=1 Tax=Plakobranchus ocellatus TaxID=259542 RepID=A0AAV3ZR05_9GAST|nr:integrase core domain protein [Plakobranchus ocellatus]